MSSFPERLKKARKAMRLSQRELSIKLGCTPQAVSNWENDISTPSYEKLSVIADILQVTPTWLLPTREIIVPCAGQVPVFKHEGDAGADVRAGEDKVISAGSFANVATGARVAIPDGYVGLLFARSGNGLKGIGITHGVGVIDSGYRGELSVCLCNLGDEDMVVEEGDRIAQLVLVALPNVSYALMPQASFDDLPTTDRGQDGFGSTGRS